MINKIGKVCLCLAIGFGVFLTSCKTIKPIKGNKKITSIESIYDSLKLSEFEYKNLNIKFNISYKKKETVTSLKGNIKILKDSIIWVSLSPGLGIEAARFMCTKDSVYFMDKMGGSVTKGKYAYIKKLYKIDVDFNSLQAILTNNFFIYPAASNEKNEFLNNFKISKDSLELGVYRKNDELVENLINIERAKFRINSYLINDVPHRRSLVVKYSRKAGDEPKTLPGFINIKSQNEDKLMVMDIEYTKVTVNGDLTFSFNVPSSYKVIVQ